MSVRVQGLVKQYTKNGTPAVRGASFTAPTGAITALLGPSGSGKTTLLRLISGLEIPDGGAVYFGDQNITQTPVQKRGVGFVFQGYALFKHLNVHDNVAFGLKLQKLPAREINERVREYLALVQLEGFEDRYPTQLSGGQQQRVAFARALATRPQVLLLDEPFGALDATVRVGLRSWLRKLHQRTHVTTILVTHDQEEALEVSEQIVVMHQGKVAQIGTPTEVYESPASSFVASFIGNNNVLDGKMEHGKLAIGARRLSVPEPALDGAAVHAVVRPKDVSIRKTDTPSTDTALIETVTRVGGYVKVDLRLPKAGTLTLHMNKSEFDDLHLRIDEHVAVDFKVARIFEQAAP